MRSPQLAYTVPGLGLLLLAGLSASCAGSKGDQLHFAQQDDHDWAYLALRAKDQGCPRARQVSCCEELQSTLSAALKADDLKAAAATIDALAISCPNHRAVALSALDHTVRPPTGVVLSTAPSIRFQLDVLPEDRIYWVGAFYDQRYRSGDPLPAGAHELDVEAHVMTTNAGTGAGDVLVRLQTRKLVDVPAKDPPAIRVTIRRTSNEAGPNAFTLDVAQWAVDEKKPTSGSSTAAPVATVAPTIASGKLKSRVPPRNPREFRGHHVMSLQKLCVSEAGRITGITPVGPRVHPRHLGTLIDFVGRFEYDPYIVNGRPVPFCYVLRVNFN